jgi:hypothetical protein
MVDVQVAQAVTSTVELTGFETRQVVGQQFLKGGQITAGKRRDTAAALVVRQKYPTPK